jgi:hypothetical protein
MTAAKLTLYDDAISDEGPICPSAFSFIKSAGSAGTSRKFQDVAAHFRALPCISEMDFPMRPDGRGQRYRALVPRLLIEHRYTRDERVPLSIDDPEMMCGWQSIPIPPSLDQAWQIFDTRKDRKTGWRRIRLVEGDAS